MTTPDIAATQPTTATPLERVPAWVGAVTWEWVAWGSIALAAFWSRFWDLGARALHHDESLHALFSWYLYTGRGYQHDPLMHGPFQFHASALMYFLFGDTDATARFAAAAFGMAIVLVPWLLRPMLGRWVALVTAGFFLVSPVFLYYGRFTREDIFVATFTLVLAIAFWRYITSLERKWLLVLSGALALAFATKESTFITVAVFGSFFTFRWIAATVDQLRGGQRWRQAMLGPDFDILILLGAFTLPPLMPFATLVFPLVGIQEIMVFQLPIAGSVRQDQLAAVVLVVGAIGVSCLVGHLWNRAVWWRCLGVFAVIWLLLYTTFLSNPGGVGTGIWGSLDYWIEQQAVRRGNQPGYYYFLLLPIYEFMPLIIGGIGAVVAAWRRSPLWFAICLLAIPALYGLSFAPELVMKFGAVGLLFGLTLAVMLFARVRGWGAFLLYWFLGALAAYSIAGEKMPWLSLHLATPALLAAGTIVGQSVSRIDWSAWWRRGGAWTALGVPLVGVLVIVVARGRIDQAGVSLATAGVIGGLALVVLGGLLWLATHFGWRQVGISLAVGGTGVLLALTLRTGFNAAFINGDTPVELLVYTQTTPDIPRLAAEIEVLASSRPTGSPPRVSIDSEEGYTWPWAWYLRNSTAAQYPALSSIPARPDADVVVIHSINDSRMDPYTAGFGQETRFRHRWWFPEDYRDLTVPQMVTNLANPASYGIWWDYFFERKTVSPLGSTDAVIYFPPDFRPSVRP